MKKVFLGFILLSLSFMATNCMPNQGLQAEVAIKAVPSSTVIKESRLPSVVTYIPPTATSAHVPITLEGAERITLQRRLGTGLIQGARWSDDGDQLIVFTSFGVYFYEVEDFELQETYAVSDGYVLARFSPEGTVAVVVDMDGNSSLIEARTGEQIAGLRDDWTILAWSPDRTLLALGHEDGAVQVVDCLTGEVVWDLTLSRFRIEELTFSPPGNILMAKDDEGWFAFWEVATSEEILREKVRTARMIRISPDEQIFVFISDLGSLRVWTLPKEWVLWEFIAEVYGPKVEWFSIHPDGETIIVLDNYSRYPFPYDIRNLVTGEPVEQVDEAYGYQGVLHQSKNIIFEIIDQRDIAIKDAVKGDKIASVGVCDYGECIDISQDGETIATNRGVWDIESGEHIHSLDVNCPVKYSENGAWLAFPMSSWHYGVMKAQDTDGFRRIFETGCWAADFALSYDGGRVACYDGGEWVSVYDVFFHVNVSTEFLASFRTIRYENNLAFSHDGKLLGSLCHGFLRIWDLEEGQQVREPVYVEASDAWWASPDLQRWLLHVHAGTDSLVTWDPMQTEPQSVLWMDTGGTYASTISPDGTLLALIVHEGIQLRDTEKGEEHFFIPWARGIPPDALLTFNEDNKWLAMYLPGGPVWLWGVLE